MSTQVGGKARFNGALQEFGYGAIKFDPTLDELRGHDDYSGISPRVKNAGCPDIAEALVAVAAARDVPDAVLQSAKIAIPVYLPGAGDYKGQHRDSAAAFLIKYDSHYYPYVCRLLNGAEERFGLTFDNSRDGETIQIKGKNVAIWSSHTANTVQYHEVKSSKDSNASPSATIAFFLPKTDENAVSDPTITRTLLPIEGWARLRPSLRRVGQLTREHFTVGGTSAKPVQRVEPRQRQHRKRTTRIMQRGWPNFSVLARGQSRNLKWYIIIRERDLRRLICGIPMLVLLSFRVKNRSHLTPRASWQQHCAPTKSVGTTSGPSTIFLATGIWVRNRLPLDITE